MLGVIRASQQWKMHYKNRSEDTARFLSHTATPNIHFLAKCVIDGRVLYYIHWRLLSVCSIVMQQRRISHHRSQNKIALANTHDLWSYIPSEFELKPVTSVLLLLHQQSQRLSPLCSVVVVAISSAPTRKKRHADRKNLVSVEMAKRCRYRKDGAATSMYALNEKAAQTCLHVP